MLDGEEPPDLDLLAKTAADHVLALACRGSDPGIGVACGAHDLPPLESFGLEASRRVVTQADAHTVPREPGFRAWAVPRTGSSAQPRPPA